MKTVKGFGRRISGGWSAESKWCAAAGAIAMAPIVFYWEYRLVGQLAFEMLGPPQSDIWLALRGLLFALILPALCISPAAAAGWLIGLFVRKAALLKRKYGLEFYWGVLYGMFVFIPYSVFWAFLFSIGIPKTGGMLLYGNYYPGNYYSPLLILLPAFIVAVTVLLGGMAGGVTGLMLRLALISIKGFIKCLKYS